jgi:hypothetical protein
MHLILYFLAAVSGSEELNDDCLIADAHYYTSANTEHFPALVSNEIDFETTKTISKDGGVYYETLIARCSNRVEGLMKYESGKAVYGFYYRYDDEGRLISLDLRYIDGHETTQEILDHI